VNLLGIDYRGDRLKHGIEAVDLKLVLEGYNRLVIDASRLLNGEAAEVSFKIKSVSANSLSIESVIEVAAVAQALFPLAQQIFEGIRTAGQMIKIWLDIQKHLNGEPPSSVQKVGSGNAVNITNNSGQILVVNGNVLNAFNTLDVGSSSQKIALPFRRRAESLSLRENGETLATYSAEDASSFHRVATAEQPLETVGEVLLTVKSPVLEGDEKWRFRYGSKTISVHMNDTAFRQEVESGRESFRNGDIYRVRLRSRQERTGRRVRTHHVIEHVLENVGPT
jgi:hypothetical protein